MSSEELKEERLSVEEVKSSSEEVLDSQLSRR